MLKLYEFELIVVLQEAATFGWLCVETLKAGIGKHSQIAATFGWLCVETTPYQDGYITVLAATFGWLCVETR